MCWLKAFGLCNPMQHDRSSVEARCRSCWLKFGRLHLQYLTWMRYQHQLLGTLRATHAGQYSRAEANNEGK